MLAQATQAVQGKWQWTWEQYVIFAIPFGLIALGGLVFLLFRNTLRTRVRVAKQLRDDPDINEWLVIFNWSRKVLYFPAILASLAGALIMFLVEMHVVPGGAGGAVGQFIAKVVGGVWLIVFILCFLVDEYEMSVKILAILVLFALVLLLWLYMLGWLRAFFRALGHVTLSMSWTGFLLIAIIFGVGVAVSWIKGLFYYVAITPNYMNIQVGITETGEQVSREEYSTRVDTGDFLERLLGFGRIVITFRDGRRLPMMLLVGRVGQKATMLESIRGKLAVDYHDRDHEGSASNV